MFSTLQILNKKIFAKYLIKYHDNHWKIKEMKRSISGIERIEAIIKCVRCYEIYSEN